MVKNRYLPVIALFLISLSPIVHTAHVSAQTETILDNDSDDVSIGSLGLAAAGVALVGAVLVTFCTSETPESLLYEMNTLTTDITNRYQSVINICAPYKRIGITPCNLDEEVLYQYASVCFPEKYMSLDDDIEALANALEKGKKNVPPTGESAFIPGELRELSDKKIPVQEQLKNIMLQLELLQANLVYLKAIVTAHKTYFDLITLITRTSDSYQKELALVNITTGSADFCDYQFEIALRTLVYMQHGNYPYLCYAQRIQNDLNHVWSALSQAGPCAPYKKLHEEIHYLLSNLLTIKQHITHDPAYQCDIKLYIKDKTKQEKAEVIRLYVDEKRQEVDYARFQAQNTRAH